MLLLVLMMRIIRTHPHKLFLTNTQVSRFCKILKSLYIICSKRKIKDEKILTEEESVKIFKILALKSQEFKSKNIDETRNYFLKEIKQN